MKKNNILTNSGMLLLFNIAKMLFPFLTLPYLTRVLSTEAYGATAYIKTVMSYMQIAVDFGFMLSATKDIVTTKKNKQKMEYVIGDSLLAKIILGVAAFAVLLVITFALPILRENIGYTLLSYLVVFESIFLMDFLFRGLEKMYVITIRFILMKTISTLFTFWLVKGDEDILLIPVFDIIGSFTAVVLVLFEMKKLDLSIRFSGFKKALDSIRESFIYFLSNAAATSFNALSTLIVGINISASGVAYWSVCMQVVSAVQACYTPIADGIYPEMIKSKNLNLIKKILKFTIPILIFGCIAAYFLADFGMMVLGGKKYLEAVPVFRMMIPVLFFGFFSILLGWPVLGAVGKAKEVTVSTVVSAIVQIALFIVLIVTDSFTLINLAIVRSITEIVLFIVRYFFFRKYKYLFEE